MFGESRVAAFLKTSHFCSQISKPTAMENTNQRKTPPARGVDGIG